ncbi:MAG: xanthine dehydrogenase family protein molybdopterin-binding subunit, partial [Pseudomonadales bacterium]|nr:xanthine dehydrogenase family protein molybdopterin-binding subunit [Pseudomonadales bacterium]
MTESAIGKSIPRKEDARFISGKGRYTDDINIRGQAYAWFVRSPLAHGRIKSISTAAAENSPGVIAVLTGAQLAEDGLGTLPCGWMIHSKDGSEMKQPPHPIMAADTVNYAGEPLAIVVAESRIAARNAAEMVDVEFEDMDAVVDLATAQSSEAIYADIPRNTCYEWELGDKEATDKAFEGAAHVTKLSIRNNRLIPNAIEPRAAIADFNPGTDELTLYTTSQNPHLVR